VDEQGFEIVTEITSVEIIAVGNRIRDLRRLIESYGDGRWRKLKGKAGVRLRNGPFEPRNCTGTKLTELGKRISR
jgi:hypothetical protein